MLCVSFFKKIALASLLLCFTLKLSASEATEKDSVSSELTNATENNQENNTEQSEEGNTEKTRAKNLRSERKEETLSVRLAPMGAPFNSVYRNFKSTDSYEKILQEVRRVALMPKEQKSFRAGCGSHEFYCTDIRSSWEALKTCTKLLWKLQPSEPWGHIITVY